MFSSNNLDQAFNHLIQASEIAPNRLHLYKVGSDGSLQLRSWMGRMWTNFCHVVFRCSYSEVFEQAVTRSLQDIGRCSAGDPAKVLREKIAQTRASGQEVDQKIKRILTTAQSLKLEKKEGFAPISDIVAENEATKLQEQTKQFIKGTQGQFKYGALRSDGDSKLLTLESPFLYLTLRLCYICQELDQQFSTQELKIEYIPERGQPDDYKNLHHYSEKEGYPMHTHRMSGRRKEASREMVISTKVRVSLLGEEGYIEFRPYVYYAEEVEKSHGCIAMVSPFGGGVLSGIKCHHPSEELLQKFQSVVDAFPPNFLESSPAGMIKSMHPQR